MNNWIGQNCCTDLTNAYIIIFQKLTRVMLSAEWHWNDCYSLDGIGSWWQLFVLIFIGCQTVDRFDIQYLLHVVAKVVISRKTIKNTFPKALILIKCKCHRNCMLNGQAGAEWPRSDRQPCLVQLPWLQSCSCQLSLSICFWCWI